MTTMHGLMSEAFSTALLSSLSEACPAGEYLKSNKLLYRPLRNAYNVAQTSLHTLSFNPEPSELDELIVTNRENWLQLENLLLDVLQNHSHDLECLVWLAMAQLFTDQPYTRLAKVLGLLEQMVTTFWPMVQPWLPDEKLRSGDVQGIATERAELQSRCLKLLFGESEDSCQIAVPLRMLPLVDDIDYVRYQREEALLKNDPQTLCSVILNHKSDIIQHINAMQGVLDAIDALDDTLAQRFSEVGLTAPGSRYFREQVLANLMAMKNLTEGLIEPWPLDVCKANAVEQEKSEKVTTLKSHEEALNTEERHEGFGMTQQVSLESSDTGSTLLTQFQYPFDRNQAFQQLRLLADFFLCTEPQSPVSYLLEKAIRWGYTPLPELMRELLQGNDGILDRITDLTGMNMTDKTPIPDVPSSQLSAVPDSVIQSDEKLRIASNSNKTDANAVSGRSPPEATNTSKKVEPAAPIPDFSNFDGQVTQNKPISSQEPSAPSQEPSGPGGLSISNLDDLI